MIVDGQVHGVPAYALVPVEPAVTGDAVAYALDTTKPLKPVRQLTPMAWVAAAMFLLSLRTLWTSRARPAGVNHACLWLFIRPRVLSCWGLVTTASQFRDG